MKCPKWFHGLGVAVIAGALGAVADLVIGHRQQQQPERQHQEADSRRRIAAKNSDFSTLTAAIKEAGLTKTLKGKGPFTRVRTHERSVRQGAGRSAQRVAGRQGGADRRAHLPRAQRQGPVLGVAARDPGSDPRFNAEPFTITIADGKATITDSQGNTINIVRTDIKAKNGVIHVIDTVMLPPDSS